MNQEEVILVNEADMELGSMEKLQAHRLGLLHRAVSVFIFNSQKELLLQKRAEGKYHSGGLWTNSCCGHPRPGERPVEAAKRRLREEMGLQCSLLPLFKFTYQTELDHQLSEHELDHVFVGFTDQTPHMNPEEAEAYRYASLNELRSNIRQQPQNYTVWFRIIMERPEIPGLFKLDVNAETTFEEPLLRKGSV